MTRKVLLPLLTAALLSSCAPSVGLQESGIAAPSLWSRMTGTEEAMLVNTPDAAIQHDWWRNFGDPTLDALVAEAVTNNKSLAIARTRVAEARANRGVSRANQLPDITLGGAATRGNQGLSSNHKVIDLASADLSASWELDLFGRNRARTAEAQAILESEEAGQRAVMVGLLAELARNYFDLRDFDRQITLTAQNLETQQKTFTLIEAQFAGDFASDFDVQRAGAQVATTQALLPQLEAGREAAMNRITLLLGQVPGTRDDLLRQAHPMKPLDQKILIAAPAKILATRPDITLAERQFAASISATDSARAELFPDLSLTALFGIQDSNLLTAQPWSVGIGLIQPVLNFGRIQSQIDAANARQERAFLNYQQTVLEALEDMENALSGYLHEKRRNDALTTATTRNLKSTDLAEQQYKAGYIGLLDLLVAQRDLLTAQSAQASSDALLRKNLINIYTAAGGGWSQ